MPPVLTKRGFLAFVALITVFSTFMFCKSKIPYWSFYNDLNSPISYLTQLPKNCFSKLDNDSKIYNGLLKFLDVLNPRHTLPSLKDADIRDAVIVSAIDDSHYGDLTYMCASMSAYKKFGTKFKRRLIVFLLGAISDSKRKDFAAQCEFIEFRFFPYNLFPSYFQNLHEYRFKPAVIALMLKEYHIVYWMDSSVRFNNSTEASSLEEYLNMLKDRNIPFTMMGVTGHSILATTQPNMYDYLPIDTKKREIEEGIASAMLFIGTKEVKSTILLRFLQCALVSECMAPPGHRLNCVFKDRYKYYAGCHRYDQSAVSIIANLYTQYNLERYIVPFKAISLRRHAP